MTKNTNNIGTGMNEEAFREAVKRDVPSDALTVTQEGDTTTVKLFFLEPEAEMTPMRNPVGSGIILLVQKSKGEELMSEVIDDIQLSSSPNDWDIEDKNGFYVVTLTYKNGREW